MLAEEIPNARLLVAKSILELRTKPQRLMPEIIGFLNQASGVASGKVSTVVRVPAFSL